MNAFLPALLHRSHRARNGAAFAALVGAALLVVPSLRAEVGLSIGVRIGAPPPGYVEVRVGRERYYEHHGVFYRPGPHGYVVVRAPRGAIVRALPLHYTRIYVGGVVYYRYGDVYYQDVRGGYVVVDPPLATTAEPLPPLPPPEDYQSVWVGKQEYFFKDGQFFTKTPEGMVWVEAPLGAVTKTLPADVRSVWYQSIEYFESDNVYFRKTPAGYEVVSAPWKK